LSPNPPGTDPRLVVLRPWGEEEKAVLIGQRLAGLDKADYLLLFLLSQPCHEVPFLFSMDYLVSKPVSISPKWALRTSLTFRIIYSFLMGAAKDFRGQHD